MAATATKPVFHTTGKMALRLGVQDWMLLRLASHDKVPHLRADRQRLFSEADEPAIRAALVEAGYLKESTAA